MSGISSKATMNTPSLFFVDPLSAGHVSFNRLYFRALSIVAEVTLGVCYGYSIPRIGPAKKKRLVRTNLRKAGKIGYRVDCLVSTLQIALLAHLCRFDAVVFSSYETISMCLASYFMPRGTYIIDHDNVDELKSPVKNFFFRSIRRRILHVSFTDDIRKRVHSTGQRSIWVPHPVRPNPSLYGNETSDHSETFRIFSPSANQDASSVSTFLTMLTDDPRLELHIKRTADLPDALPSNVFAVDYFEDYEQMLRDSDFVLVLSRFEYRVSGVAYEALGAKKPVLMALCRFSVMLKKDFPESIHFVDDIHSTDEILAIANRSYRTVADGKHLSDYSVEGVASRWSRVLRVDKGRNLYG